MLQALRALVGGLSQCQARARAPALRGPARFLSLVLFVLGGFCSERLARVLLRWKAGRSFGFDGLLRGVWCTGGRFVLSLILCWRLTEDAVCTDVLQMGHIEVGLHNAVVRTSLFFVLIFCPASVLLPCESFRSRAPRIKLAGVLGVLCFVSVACVTRSFAIMGSPCPRIEPP